MLNPGETQHTRAPRPLFMGPTRKNRRSRGARKNTKNSANHQTENANGSEPNQMVNACQSDTNHSKSDNQSTPTAEAMDTKEPENKLRTWATKMIETATDGQPANQQQAVEPPNTPKRVRSAQTSPNVADTGVPNQPKKQRTFADVVTDDLKLQIINKTDEITETQLNLIETSLMSELDKHLETLPSSVPRYHTSSFRYGILKLICSDAFSAEWIKGVIESMPPLWEGAALEISICKPPNANSMARGQQKHPSRAPRRPTIRFFVPSGIKKPTFEEVAKKLQMQNHPLNTSDWIAWKAEDKENGTFYHVSADVSAIELIRAKAGRLFYYFSKIKVNLPKEPKGEGSQEESGENGVPAKDNQ